MMLSAVASAAHPHRAAAKLGSRAPTRALRNAAVAPRRKVARQLIEATVSKDNVFANNPGSLAALSAMGVNNQVPVTPNMMPFEDLASATMPHRERLKVFSGSAHPELSDVRTHHDDPFAKKIHLGVRFRDVAPTPVPRRARALSRASTKARTSASAFARAIRRARPLLERRGSRRDARGKTRPPVSKFRSPLKTPFPNRALADEAADDRAKRKLGRFGPRL